MTDPLANRFARWRATGDPAGLADVFDRTAPELLRLATHLCADPVDAEDLVQATFLAAIESASRFDARRPLLPWLVAILTHRAQAERRRARRASAAAAADARDETNELAARADEPSATLVRRELSQQVLEALDRIPEPFRQPTLLRVVHGLAPADIAHTLSRSPATVRTQIHRGLARLRAALPAGVLTGAVAVALAGVATAPRGLAAVRETVLVEGQAAIAAGAAAATTSAASLTATGGILVTKKLVSLVAAAAALLSAFWWLGDDAPAPADATPADVVVDDAREHGEDEPAGPERVALDANASRTDGDREQAPVDRDADAEARVPLGARVLHAETLEPLVGARVELFAPQRSTLLDLQRRFAGWARPTESGAISSRLEWLNVGWTFTAEQVVDGAPIDARVAPTPDADPDGSTRTDANGAFSIPARPAGGILRISHDGFGTRLVPVAPAKQGGLAIGSSIADAAPTSDDPTVGLWPLRRVTGRVVTTGGETPPTPLQLRLYAEGFPSSGAWDVTTDENGAFTAEVAAARVSASCTTPGWTITQNGLHPERRTLWIFSTDVGPEQDGLLCVARYDVAHLVVVDAATEAPIETIRVVSRDESGMPRHCGVFHAPDGRFPATGFDPNDLIGQAMLGGFPKQAVFDVWADGYQASEARVEKLFGSDPETVTVRLVRGPLPSVSGHVRGVDPLAAATVHLRVFHPLNWDRFLDKVVARTRAGDDGTFALRAPPGRYLLEAHTPAGDVAQQVVALPHDATVVLDFAANARVIAQLVDGDGNALPNHNVAIHGTKGKQIAGRTDATGQVSLGPLLPGPHMLSAPYESVEGSWSGDVSAPLQLVAGEVRTVQLVVAKPTAVRPRVEVLGAGADLDLRGWQAEDANDYSRDAETLPLDAAGRAALDLLPGKSALRITTPDGTTWTFPVAADARGEFVVTIDFADGATYAGVLVDEATDEPVADARVFATLPGPGKRSVSTATDRDGRFVFRGLAARPASLRFHSRRDSSYPEGGNNDFTLVGFVPNDSAPATVTAPARIVVPRGRNRVIDGHPDVTIRGQATDAAGHASDRGMVMIYGIEEREAGTLRLFPTSGWQHVGPDGRFELRVPRSPKYQATLYAGRKQVTDTFDHPGGGDDVTTITHDLDAG